MNWSKHLGSLLLAGALMLTPMTPALAVNDSTEQNVTVGDNENTDAANTDGTSDTSQNTEDSGTDSQTSDEQPAEGTDSAQTDDDTEEPDLSPSIDINAKASICVNAETGTIIHSSNAEEKEYPASTTKIMTALLVLENCDDLQNTVTMQAEDFTDVEGGASTSGFQEGETVTVESLMYGLLLPSGNEAANALARYIGGDVSGFVDMMNQKAEELGCVNTHFVNPNGLHDDDHYTCAYDLYLMAQAAMQYDTFQTMVNTAQKKLPATNKQAERLVYTTNELIRSRYSSIYYDNCYGIKTGHTTPAGYCFVSYAKNSDGTLSYYSVVMGCDFDETESYAGSFVETKKLFEWAFDKYRLRTATSAGTAVTECPVRLGKDKDNVTLVTGEDVSVLLPKDADVSMLDVQTSTEESYNAPISEGDKLGTVTYSYNGTELASADLVALTDVERSQVLYYLDQTKQFAMSPVFMGIVIALVALLVILCLIRRHNKRKRRQKMLRRNKARRANGAPPSSQQHPDSHIEIRKRSLDKKNKK